MVLTSSSLRSLTVAGVTSIGLLAAAQSAEAATIFASHDAGIAENAPDSTDNDGTAQARHNPLSTTPDRNEWIVLQFDLTGVNKALVANASVNVTMHRENSNNNKNLALFASDGQAWNESNVTFNNMPGLINDGDPITRGEDLSILTNIAPGGFNVTGADAEGTLVSLNPAGLTSYINSMTSNILTVLISFETSSNGTWNIATKEATTLASGAAVPPNHAPHLTFDEAVPEPSSMLLLGLAGATALRRRRR